MSLDAAALGVIRAALEHACREMGAALARSAFSPNIKERRDFSCALFDADGRLVAQAEHIPVHLGSMEASVAAVLEELGGLDVGDTAVCNDPYRGGTHVPDVTMVAPVYVEDGLLGYAANRAHHADMGGIAPGSMPAGARRVDEEGVVIPPVLLMDAGEPVASTFAFLDQTRDPAERRADFRAQRAAVELGANRVAELAATHGVRSLADAFDALIDGSRRWLVERLADVPSGVWEAEDALDDDGVTDEPVRIQVVVERDGDRLRIDYTGSAGQRDGNVNAPLAVTQSASYYVAKMLLDPEIPSNHGLFAPLDVVAEAGSVLNPRPPAAVSAGNVETSQRVVDVLLRALAPALPDRVPALSQGTMNNVTIGAVEQADRRWSYYETIAGGEGATPSRAGMNGVHTHMTNTLNTPIEALEHAYPMRVTRYTIRRGTGGPGRFRGGDGLVREVELLEDAVVSLLTDRRASAPAGLAGGQDGSVGRNVLVEGASETALPAKRTRRVAAGSRVRIETPGGGGWGR